MGGGGKEETSESPKSPLGVDDRGHMEAGDRSLPLGLRPPKMMALTSTPLGSSHLGWMMGHWEAGQVKRALGWEAGPPGMPTAQGWFSQVVMAIPWGGGGRLID